MNRFNYVITTDTCCDLPKDYLKEKEIEEKLTKDIII